MYGVLVDTTRLSPSMLQLTFGGAGLEGLQMPDATDAYIKALFPRVDTPSDAPFDPTQLRTEFPADMQPAGRRYTVRRWDEDTGEMILWFVDHSDKGIGGPWAAGAQPGDVLVFTGPSGGYRPDPLADWHLLAGDESALPAIAASLETLPIGARAVVRVVVDGPAHELPLADQADVDLQWLHRSGNSSDARLLEDEVQGLAWPEGRVQAFVHGEADEIRGIRRHLLVDRGLTRAGLSCSPYWRRTMTDEAWRAIKKEYVASMEADAS